MAIGGGGGAYENSKQNEILMQSKLGQALASMNAANATADLNSAKADAERSSLAMQQPDALRRNAMTNFGVPLDEDAAVSSYLQSGNLGGKYSTPVDGIGPAAPQPEWASKLGDVARAISGVQTAVTIGDKNSENIAKAGAINRESRLSDAIIAGTADRNRVGGAQAAVAGKDLYNRDSTGSVLDQFTGALDTANPLAASTINLRREQAGAQKANAAQSYASADNSRASAAKTRSELDRGVKTGDIVVQTDADGRIMLINKLTGISRPATSEEGKELRAGAKGGAGGKEKPLTEGQSKALLFGARMQDSSSIIDELASKGVNKSIPGARAGYGVGAVVNAMQPQERQRLEQSKRDFINAVLRRESGAVISDSEFANAEQQYFPQPGEGKETIAQKRRARDIATRGILAEVPDSENRVRGIRGAAPADAAPTPGGFTYLGKEE